MTFILINTANKMHKDILTEEQLKLLPTVMKFMNNFFLVGGTATALQIGHRRSIDFDLFSIKDFKNAFVRKKISEDGWKIEKVFKDEIGQYTFFINGVQMTFFHYPFQIAIESHPEGLLMPDLTTLASMKAYALGRRAKWKDYVDLYFIFNRTGSIKPIINKGKEIFGNEFNENLFRKQLTYYEDINYDEKVEFLPGFEVSDEEIKDKLIKYSLE